MTETIRLVARDGLRSVRSLWRRPAFTGLAVALFALGIAAITSV
jgi:hypothetical protein